MAYVSEKKEKGIAVLSTATSIIVPAILGVSLIFTMGYSSGLIYIIGAPYQLMSLFEGIIAGTLVFSFAGYIIGSGKTYRLFAGLAFGVAMFFTVYYIIHSVDYVVPNGLLTVCSFIITGAFLPVSQLATVIYHGRFLRGLAVPAGISVISIIVIAELAILYEDSGQSNLAQIVTLMNSVTLVALILMLLVLISRKSSGTGRIQN